MPAPSRAIMPIMGAQRATKILGIFARLTERDGKPGYLQHIPRVRSYLDRALAHPALAEVRVWYETFVVPVEPRAMNGDVAAAQRPFSRAMLLAAGLGKRMRPLTAARPKPWSRSPARPSLDHVLDRLAAAGVETRGGQRPLLRRPDGGASRRPPRAAGADFRRAGRAARFRRRRQEGLAAPRDGSPSSSATRTASGSRGRSQNLLGLFDGLGPRRRWTS